MQVTEITGDLFTAPDDAVLIHACNCKGRWGAGIALRFKELYPAAFESYSTICEKSRDSPDELLGTALLIPPQPEDLPRSHWIGCLFTSLDYGKRKDTPEVITANTKSALADLFRAILSEGQQHDGSERIIDNTVVACRFNSGKFGVPWKDTRKILEEMNGVPSMVVVSPPEYAQQSLVELRTELERRGISQSGSKSDLAARLSAADVVALRKLVGSSVKPSSL